MDTSHLDGFTLFTRMTRQQVYSAGNANGTRNMGYGPTVKVPVRPPQSNAQSNKFAIMGIYSDDDIDINLGDTGCLEYKPCDPYNDHPFPSLCLHTLTPARKDIRSQ
ncbi:hypothetical protein MANI_015549 [Metarhizium anisopliae]